MEGSILTWMHRVGARLGAIALLAMLARAIVPAGYMLAEADTGHGRYLTVTMCSEHGGGKQVIDLDTGKQVDPGLLKSHSGGKPDSKPSPCVFAAAAPIGASDGGCRAGVFPGRLSHRVFSSRRICARPRHSRAAAAVHRASFHDLPLIEPRRA